MTGAPFPGFLMLFNSLEFLFGFLPLTVAGFFLCGRMGGLRLAMGWLVAASLFFYSWWNPPYVLLLFSSILVNFLLGRRLQARPSRPLLAAGVAANLAVIGYYKYADFFLSSVGGLTGLDLEMEAIFLPLGISFFTFQQIAYLVDAHRGQVERGGFLDYALFVSFFPQLIAGPIVHHREMMPQFRRRGVLTPDSEAFALGLGILSIGLFKKVIIADGVARYATPVFDAAAGGYAPSFFEAWGGTLAYTFQLYFDFSGYSDMAIGLGLLFGIRLPLNFASPYKATSIIEFWSRWHMTLSRFLRDYLYIPLGGNRRGSLRRYLNLMITMLLGGLWHGAGWTFVAWGALHGGYLVVNHAWRALRVRFGRPGPSGGVGRWAARLLTFLAVVVAWVPFRAESFEAAGRILAGLSGFNGIILPPGWHEGLGPVGETLAALGIRFAYVPGFLFDGMREAALLALLTAFVFFAPNTQEWFGYTPDGRPSGSYRTPFTGRVPGLLRGFRPGYLQGMVMGALCLAAVVAIFTEVPQEFLYFQF